MTERRLLYNKRGISAEVITHNTGGAPANALIIRLPEERSILSSRDGSQRVKAICNCYLPDILWSKFHSEPDYWESYLGEILGKADLKRDETAALSTGVNMDYAAWQETTFRDLWVLAFVTAGVSSNALRIGMDKGMAYEKDGAFEEIGTINTIMIASPELEVAPLAASFITITEAKNIALQELNVRSCYTPAWQATGTGTDQIVTVSGNEGKRNFVGGHTRLGEIMAQAATAATKQAIINSLKGLKLLD